jgi:aminomethyltransferase
MVDFHGWVMPIRYGSIPEEHARVRGSAGIFDLCHMGRLEVTGKDAGAWVQRVITNDLDLMKTGDARYSLITNEEGGIIDDAVVYRLEDAVFIVVNASNREAVIAWMESHRGGLDARLADRSDDLAMIAIQGPRSADILPAAADRIDADLEAMKYYSITGATILGKRARIARTGYTGENGFEVYLEAADAPAFWRRALEAGGDAIAPIGLGARDTLRLEAGMPLYGNDIDISTDPFEAGLGFAVKLEKPADFIGKRRLAERKAVGPRRRLTGFRVEGRRIARQGMRIVLAPPAGAQAGEASPAGVVTSGAPSPTLGFPIAMGYLDTSVAGGDLERLRVDIRGNLELVSVHPLPFYSRTRKKKQGS